jgi:hypothetical protein
MRPFERVGQLGVKRDRSNQPTSMISDRTACSLAILVVLFVLFIFFFQALEGPYSAVHGPVTALLSIRAATHLRIVIRAGMSVLCISPSCALFFLFATKEPCFAADAIGFIDTSIERLSLLRC